MANRDDGQDDGADDDDEGMRELVRMLRDMARLAGFDPDRAIHLGRLGVMLEVVGGNLDMAATLYWDDFIATHHRRNEDHGDGGGEEEERPPQEDHEDGDDGDGDDPAAEGMIVNGVLQPFRRDGVRQNQDQGNPPVPPPPPAAAAAHHVDDASPLVRRLDEAFARHADDRPARAQARRERRRAAMEHAEAVPAAAEIPIRPRRSARVASASAGAGGGIPPRPPAALRGARPPPEVAAQAASVRKRQAQDPPARGEGEHQAALPDDPPEAADPERLARVREFLHRLCAQQEESSDSAYDVEAGVAKGMSLRSVVGAAINRRKRKACQDAGGKEDATQADGDGPPRKKLRMSSDKDAAGAPNGTAAAGHADDSAELQTSLGQDEEPCHRDAEDAYLSDNDWVWHGTYDNSPSSSRVDKLSMGPPTDLLWGLSKARSKACGSGSKSRKSNEGGNAIVDDLEIASSEDDESQMHGVPRTWLSAGFSLSECASGLCVKPPSEDDLSFFAWSRQIQRNVPPPPYHCRSLTAIMSVVTATILTGASIQAGGVTTASARTPFYQLNKEERAREYEARLSDALSALLWIAVQASVARKKLALKAVSSSVEKQVAKNDELQVEWNRLQYKLGLIPTCNWNADPNTGEIRIEDDTPLQLVTSLIHVEDVKCYVSSNIKMFLASGGVALFLETLLKIHGKGAITKMLHRSEGKSLIRCTCEERHTRKLQEIRQRNLLSGRSAPALVVPSSNALKTDTTPPGSECISVEMISLLLTGKIHSSWRGWDTGPLEFGLLTTPTTPEFFVDKRLSRPKKPVWILLGPTCYSVVYTVGCPEQGSLFAHHDVPGTVAHMRHFNSWYGQRRSTCFRLTVGRSDDSLSTDWVKGGTTVADIHELPSVRLLRERMKARAQAEKDRYGAEVVSPELLFTQQELDGVVAHPDDPKFYPNQFKLWRYDICPTVEAGDDENQDQKRRAQTWTPYCRLASRGKLLVEAKLGPALHRILLTRWPRTSVFDRFEPSDPDPVV